MSGRAAAPAGAYNAAKQQGAQLTNDQALQLAADALAACPRRKGSPRGTHLFIGSCTGERDLGRYADRDMKFGCRLAVLV